MRRQAWACPDPWLSQTLVTPSKGFASGTDLCSRPAAGAINEVSFPEDGDAGRRLRQGLAANGKGSKVYRRLRRWG